MRHKPQAPEWIGAKTCLSGHKIQQPQEELVTGLASHVSMLAGQLTKIDLSG